ncbi:MAG TPA: ABC transporter substrate-binding protein [Candidatus Methanoperedens sp.]
MKKYFYAILIVILLSAVYVGYERSNVQKSIYVVAMTANEMSAALKNGTIDGFIIWEPFPAKAEYEGYGRYLVSSQDAWENHPSCDLAISDDITDEDTIKAITWVHIKATRFINDPANREEVIKYGMEFSGLDRNMVSAAINNTIYIEFPDLNQTRKAFEILEKAGAFDNSVSSLGYSDVDDFLSDMFIDKYYNEVRKKLDEDPEWAPPAVNGSLRFGYIEGNIHYLGMYIAQKEGFFNRVGLIPGKNIQFTGYRNGGAMTDAFKQRDVDVANLGTVVLLRYKINNNGRIHIINGVNTGGSALVVRNDSNIKSLDDLNGRKIATTAFGSCQDTIMRKMFEGFEIKPI